jgi:hypothetical protein
MTRYVTDPWLPWLLTGFAFIILWVIWRLTHLAIDLLAYGLSKAGPGASMPEEGE